VSESRVALDDRKLLDLYKRFQEARRAIGEIYTVTKADDFLGRGSYHANAIFAVKL